jgi:hypothetical protein
VAAHDIDDASPERLPRPARAALSWSMSSLGTSNRPTLPGIDDRLVEPGTPYEMIDGELVHVSPADPPHATRHSKLSALLEAHAGMAFDVASDMLTRTSERSDIAPDASVFPIGPDPVTGGRQLEQLAFQVVSTESFSRAAKKAADLIGRGVRRVFAIDVQLGRVLEWSPAIHSWSVLDLAGYIEDPALEASLPIEALAHAAKADDAVARALLLKRNAVIEAVRAQDRAEGMAQGRAEGRVELARLIIAELETRGLVIHGADRARILGETDQAVLVRWLSRAATCADLAEILA